MTVERVRRCRGERGMAMVTGLVLLFAFTAAGVIWLARDVDRSVSNRTAAQSIAFQAARSGAQQLDVGALRERADVVVDADAASHAARATADELFAGYGVDGAVTRVSVDSDGLVEVEVRISDPAGDVTGAAAAHAEVGG
jgi:Tfp pilus assembly protein PilX